MKKLNLTKSFNKTKSSFQRIGVLLLLLSFTAVVYASHDKHYGKAVLSNATGNGTVYLSTSASSNSGQTGTTGTAGAAGSTSYITWNCGEESSNDSKTYYARGTANNGYYYAGWANTADATSYTAATTGKSFSASSKTSGSPTTTTIFGFFKPVTLVNATAVVLSPTNPSTSCEDYTGLVTFSTTYADAKEDFKTPTFGSVSGNGTFSVTDYSFTAGSGTAGTITVSYKFVGKGHYGSDSSPRTRSNSATLTLTSAGGENSGTCAFTANFPNATVFAGSAADVSTVSTTPKEATATFPVQWVDDKDDFGTPTFGSIIGGGAWTVNSYSYTATDSQSGTITVNYTFNPNGAIGDHSARLTLAANANAGGASNYVDINAVSEELASDDASVTVSGTTTKYSTLAAAITAANGQTGAVITLLRNIPSETTPTISAPYTITSTMTLDLNAFTITGTGMSSAAFSSLVNVNMSNAANVLTITDSRSGGKISGTGSYASGITAVKVTKGVLNLTKGDIEITNSSTTSKGIDVADGAKLLMSGGTITSTASTGACGVYVKTTPANKNMIAVSGGTINASATATAIGIDCESSTATITGDPTDANVILSGVTVNAGTTTGATAYAVLSQAGVCLLINSGTYNATTTTTNAYAVLSRGYTAIVNGTFNGTATTQEANGLRVEAGIAAVRNGNINATAATKISHASYVAANAKLIAYGGTFHGFLNNAIVDGWATGCQIVDGGTLETEGGTFFGETSKTGLSAEQNSYGVGVYANTGSTVTMNNATLRGQTDNTYLNQAHALYTKTTKAFSLTSCTLVASSAYKYAYGVYTNATPLSIKNCNISSNTAHSYSYGIQSVGVATTAVENSTFNNTSDGIYAYGAYVTKGTLNATNTNFIVQTRQATATAAAKCYLRGIYVAPSYTANLNGCSFDVSGNATYSKEGFGLYIDGTANIDDCTVNVYDIATTAYAIYNTSSTNGLITVGSGKFKATATSTYAAANGTAAAAKEKLYGGYYNTNTNLAKYLPEGYGVETLPTTSTEYGEGYRYAIRPTTDLGVTVCKIGSTPYSTLEEALEFVNKNTGTEYTILMVADYTLPAGNYTLPAKATLLVPYKSNQTEAIGTSHSLNSSTSTRSAFKTLTFASGAKMTVYGTIEASAQQHETNQQLSGKVAGPYGYMVLNGGSSITLESGAILVAWGYICGAGTISVKNGAKSYEMLQLGWYKGGNTSSKLNGAKNTYKVFLMTDYAYQNIECPITYYPGAQALAAASTDYFSPNDIELVGTTTTSLFKMVEEEASADTWVRKEYDPTTDYTNWTMNNGAAMSGIKMDSYSTDGFYLPITSNFRIVMNYGEMEIKKDIEFLPGSELVVKKEAIGKVNSGVNAVFYDGTDWCTGLTGTSSGTDSKYYYPVDYSPSWKAATGKTTNPRVALYKEATNSTAPNYLPDAQVDVEGVLDVTGKIYTTGDGVASPGTTDRNANIFSTNENAGKIVFNTTAPTSTITMYKCTHMYGVSSGKSAADMVAGGNSTAYSAYLKNADGTYETTGGTTSGSSWIYKNDHWVMVTTEGCLSVEQISSVKHYYAYPAGFVEVSSNTEDPTTHLFHDAATGERAFLKEPDCTWWEVEPTPYDGNKYKCVNPDHNGKYKYYEYVGGQWQEAVVTVTWKNGSSTLATYSSTLYGTRPKYLDPSPTRDKTAGEYYTWTGWTKGSTEGEFFAKDAELPIATENTTYYAYFETHKFEYTISFKNYDEAVLEAKRWAHGEVPTYEGTPVKPSTTAKEYTHDGWSTSKNGSVVTIPAATAAATYYAHFSESDRMYTVQWVNYNGTVLKEEQVAYNTTPSAPVTPTRPNDAFYTYTFDSWSPAISAVTGNQTYTATYNYSQKVTKYDINFKNGSTTIYTQSLPSGETPVYGGSTPTRDETAEFTYTFDGWSATDGGSKLTSLPTVSGAANYYALFTHTTKKYTIRWKSEDGKVLYETDTNVPYGSTPEYNSATPTKARVGSTVYTFDGWSSTIGGDKIALPYVTGHATYYAHFSNLPVYTVTFNANGHGTAPASQEVESGSKVIEPTAPTADEWIFGGWYKEAGCTNAWNFASDEVTANTTLFAKWTAAVAKIGTDYYATLPAAITTANGTSNATVTMLQNVTITSEISLTAAMTIDLNGKEVKSELASATGVFKINASGKTITIKDSGTGGKINHTATYEGYIYGINLAAGSLKLESGTIYARNDASSTGTTYRANGIYSTAATTITISGGTVEAYSPNCLAPFGIYTTSTSGTLTMTGGTVKSRGKTTSRGIYVKGTTSLSNATITATNTSGSNCYAIFAKSGTMTINGGTYTASGTTATCYAIHEEAGTVTINGGLFCGGTKELDKTGGTATIKGGYYVHDTNIEDNCATNYHVLPASLTEDGITYNYKVAEAYTVTFNANGHGTAPNQQVIEKGGKATEPSPAPTAEGYDFGGWYKETTCTTAWNFTSDVVTGDNTLHAKWTPVDYTITYSAPTNGSYTIKVASGAASSASKTANYGQTITLAAAPTTGYHFVSWTIKKTSDNTDVTSSISLSSSTNQNATFTMPTYGVTVIATFAINTYAISYAAGTYGSGSLAGGTKTHGTAYSLSSSNSAFTRTGYTYDGWSTNAAGTTKDYNLGGSYTTNAAQTFYPHWVATTYTLSYDLAGGTVTSENPASYTIESAVITLNNPTKTGYTFAGWTGTDLGSATTTVTIAAGSTGNRSYTATWTCASPTSLSITSDNKWDFCEGESMTLEVSGSNIATDGSASYQWNLNGSPISGATGKTYTVASMTRTNAGTYTCTVTNGTCDATTSGYDIKVWTFYHNASGSFAHGNLTFSSAGKGTITVELAAGQTYEFKLNNNMSSGNWFGNTGTMTGTIAEASAWVFGSSISSNCHITAGLAGNYEFIVDYSNSGSPKVSVTYPTATQAANKIVYWDASIHGNDWSKLVFRVGTSTNSNASETAMTSANLVPGTDQFYAIKTCEFGGMTAWTIANNTGWTGTNSVYKTNTNDEYAVTKSIEYQHYAVVDPITIIPTTSGSVGGEDQNNNCTFYTLTKHNGMLTHTATITTPSNGTITIAYTDVEGASQSRTATTAGLAHRCILTITAAPNPGYALSSLTVGGSAFTSGETYILDDDVTISATFAASIADRELDVVDWTNNSVTINVTNLKTAAGKNDWTIRVNETDYARAACNTTTRTLTVTGLSLTPNDNLLIQVKNGSGIVESQHNYTIPKIYTASDELSGTTSTSVVYVYGGKLTISGNTTLAALYVCPGAEVEVTSGKLTVGKLVLRTKPWQTAAISGSVEATYTYYTRIAPDGSDSYPTGQYYQFGIPYACAISAVRLSDGTIPAYSTTWLLKSYNEERRAASGTELNNWDALASDGTIAAGGGYEMFSTVKYYREYYFPVSPRRDNTSVAVTRHGDDKNNSGWNIVCSPLMNVYENTSSPVDGLKVSWLLPDGSYDQAWPETIWPAMPFSYQASATGTLDFSTSEFNQTVSAAPRRAAYNETIQTEWIHLDAKDANGVGDHTSIFVHPNRFAETYETGIDVAKQSLTASRAIIYSSHAYGDMAFAGVADALLEQGVALTVYSPAAQELTISMRENDWLNRMAYVLLIDNETGMQINLLNSDYTFDAAEGTTAGRFIIRGVFLAPQVTTDLSGAGIEGEHARKLMIDQKIYIEVNDRLYDTTGKLVNRK